MTIRLDHLMWGAPSLEVGMAEAERRFGILAAEGGVHPGLGTRNALLSLGDAAYLEIIAPDPNQDLSGNLGERLATLEAPALITWAAGSEQLTDLASSAAKLALTVRGPIPTSRRTPDGSMLYWELLFLGGHRFGSLVPFFIDWLDTPNPATTNPRAGTFTSLEVRSPDADELNGLFDGLGVAYRAKTASTPALIATIETRNGPVVLESAPATEGWTL